MIDLSLLIPDLDTLPVTIDILSHSPRVHWVSLKRAYRRTRKRLIAAASFVRCQL